MSTCVAPVWLTRREAAEYLGVKPQTLAIWASAGRYRLPFHKLGRSVRYSKDDLDAFLARRRVSHTGQAIG
jgi:excisionase family DNA binding protein